jgi:hypothetical protein
MTCRGARQGTGQWLRVGVVGRSTEIRMRMVAKLRHARGSAAAAQRVIEESCRLGPCLFG